MRKEPEEIGEESEKTFRFLLGNLIRERREEAGFTQQELGEEAFPDRDIRYVERTIGSLERGESAKPRFRTYWPVCEVLNIDLQSIRALRTRKEATRPSSPVHISDGPREDALTRLCHELGSQTATPSEFSKLLQLPNADVRDMIRPSLPTEKAPYTWQDHVADVSAPNEGLVGTLLSALVMEVAFPGFLNPEEQTNYALMLTELSYVLPNTERQLLRTFSYNRYSVADGRIFSARDPMIEHLFYHDFSVEDSKVFALSIDSTPFSYGEATTALEKKIARSDQALAWAERVSTPLPMWKETKEQTLAYETLQLLLAELSHPRREERSAFELLGKKLQSIEAADESTLRSKFSGELALSFREGQAERFLQDACQSLAGEPLDSSGFLHDLAALNLSAQTHDKDAPVKLSAFLGETPDHRIRTLVGYQSLILPSLRKLILQLGPSLGARTSLLRMLQKRTLP